MDGARIATRTAESCEMSDGIRHRIVHTSQGIYITIKPAKGRAVKAIRRQNLALVTDIVRYLPMRIAELALRVGITERTVKRYVTASQNLREWDGRVHYVESPIDKAGEIC